MRGAFETQGREELHVYARVDAPFAYSHTIACTLRRRTRTRPFQQKCRVELEVRAPRPPPQRCALPLVRAARYRQ